MLDIHRLLYGFGIQLDPQWVPHSFPKAVSLLLRCSGIHHTPALLLSLELTWLRGVHHLFVVEHGLPYGAILHFHVSSRESSRENGCPVPQMAEYLGTRIGVGVGPPGPKEGDSEKPTRPVEMTYEAQAAQVSSRSWKKRTVKAKETVYSITVHERYCIPEK